MNKGKPYDLWEEVHNPPKLFFEDEVRDGFFIGTMMKRFWAAQLKVLAEIDKICKRHSIKWFADFGTLIGAVRHGGYIPWDDDLDISMLRDEYIAFMKYAQNELPDEYIIKDVQYLEDFENMVGRVNNSIQITYSEEHLKEFFGCPYIVGVDIFPLDGLYKDEQKEKERIQRATNIFGALVLAGRGETSSDFFNSLLTDIENKNHVVFKRKENIKRQLILLADKVISECPVSEAENVALMSFWIEHRNHKYSKNYYEQAILMPFEYVQIQVPVQYDAVLRAEYGKYMRIIKSGGIHDYPLYMNQEELLKDNLGENVLRYTMPTEISPQRNLVSSSDRTAEIIDMLKQVHIQLEKLCAQAEKSAVSQLVEGCSSLISSLYGLVYDRGDICSIRESINEYCSVLNRIKEEDHSHSSEHLDITDVLNKSLDKVCVETNDLLNNRKKEILFLPVKEAWWQTMEPEWREAISNEQNDVYVMPLLYLEKDFLQDNGEEKNDGGLFPDYVNCTCIEDYDIEKRHPDKVYIQNPYDGFNTMIAVPSFFYSKNLLNHTDELIYLPCYDVDSPESKDDKITSALRTTIEQPAVYYSDKIIVKNEEIKAVYVDYLVTLTGKETEQYWSDKVQVSTAPHCDSRENLRTEKRRLFFEHYGRNYDPNRKIILMQIDSAYIVQGKEKAIEGIRRALSQIKERRNAVLCIFSFHETIDQLETKLKEEDEELLKELKNLLFDISNDNDLIMDKDGLLYNMDPYFADAYYGTAGVLAHRCMMNDLKVMFMAPC